MNIIPMHRAILLHLFVIVFLSLFLSPPALYSAYKDDCPSNQIVTPDQEKQYFDGNREITSKVCLGPGTYHYKFVNIYNGGKLIFPDATVDFWAKSILVENGGSLIAGSPGEPVGTTDIKNTVTIHLYGDENDNDGGITCKTDPITCGVSADLWENGDKKENPLVNGKTDYFYKYKKLPADNDLNDKAYFGRKVLAVSYGGILQMFGKKGAVSNDVDPQNPGGKSWVRLNATINQGEIKLRLDKVVDWQKDDKVVVTTTDYLPSHSEQRTIDIIQSDDTHSDIFMLETKGVSFPHVGQKYSLSAHNIPDRLKDSGFKFKEVETRAAVALLTRNIRIVSEKCGAYDALQCKGMPEEEGTYFGGHTILRQGFKQYQVQGVEFRQLGQGGRMAHAPINFHLTREVPDKTFVRDCSINESMAHWIELRGTQNVTLERNVGYNSIGHGYYLSDGTEANNVLRANIGIHSRAAVDSGQNPRKVPGVMAMTSNENPPPGAQLQQYESDYMHPSVFQIMNAYNIFEYNMAVGAGTCGACYWIVPSRISGLSSDMKWSGYAGIQYPGVKNDQPYGRAPLKSFKGNFCSTAQYSLITVGDTATCNGVILDFKDGNKIYKLQPIPNKFAQDYYDQKPTLYPDTSNFANYTPALCDGKECDKSVCLQGNTDNCPVTVIDSYTSSFHWAQQNFAAIWLRNNWFLVTDSALTDVLNGGLTMVSGGSYDQVINGYWALTRNSVFIGNTQSWDPAQQNPGNAYASPAGPFNTYPNGLTCLTSPDRGYCLSKAEGISMPIDKFGVSQRLYNIYDGPTYQENNAYLQIKKLPVNNCGNGNCKSQYMYGSGYRAESIPKAKEGPYKGQCILPNAAIGWKQPNGFYYPPAFHSRNLYFDKVDLRHYVIVPLFKPGTADVYEPWVSRDYCYYPGIKSELFAKDFTDVDRQTELNDDDGSISGLAGAKTLPYSDFEGTISVNKEKFYLAPNITLECSSDQTCFQAPFDYVTAVVYPNQFKPGAGDDYCKENAWCNDCQQRNCYGVPIYRQYYTAEEENGGKKKDVGQSMRMMGAGIWQRSTMVANLGKYYIDTAVSSKTQIKKTPLYGDTTKIFHNLNVFEKNNSYNFFLLYAKPSTRITFQIYVGKDSKFTTADNVSMVRVGTKVTDGKDEVVVLQGSKLNFTPVKNENKPFWPTNWIREYKSDSGILEVTMDMGFSRAKDDNTRALADDFGNKAKKEICKPKSFCRWDDTAQQCCAANDLAKCDSSVCGWSNKALDCPSGGCLGFQVKFPDKFVADDDTGGANRPDTEPYPVKDWNVGWKYADQKFNGDLNSCIYSDTNKPEPVTPDLWKE
ncbi:MAG: hypothetical protein CSYNP_00716 [Syntrophus sp. SKADARSKE-3]|nr:hypothetical protein [Syntrophus sp. SKADARSKE-3]